MFLYYLMLSLGVLFVIAAVISFIVIYRGKDYSLLKIIKKGGVLLIGVLMLVITLPSVKYVVLKEYDVVTGKCVIEIDTAGRSSSAEFNMLNKDEWFSFRNIPELDAYGKSIPYFCEVTVTKDHMVEISYKIYDEKTRKLIISGS